MLRAVFAIWIVACGITRALPPKEAVPEKGSSEKKHQELLVWASEALPLLGTDPDIEAQGRVKIAEAFLRAGDFEKARARALEIPDFRRGIVLAALATAAARKDETKLAQECLTAAIEAAGKEAGWKQERIAAQVCVANAELGRLDEAFEQLKKITELDDVARARAGFARAYVRLNKLHAAGEQAGEAKGGFSISTAPLQAEAFLEIAEAQEQAKDFEGARATARKAMKSTENLGWLSIDSLRRAGELFHRLGDTKESAVLLENAKKIASQVSDRADFKGGVISGLSLSYARCDRRADAIKLLQQAEKAADALELNFRCAPLAAIGAAWARLGDAEAAERVWRKCAAVAAEHKNPRVKGMGVIDLCVSLAGADATMPKSVERVLSAAIGRSTGSSPN